MILQALGNHTASKQELGEIEAYIAKLKAGH